MTQHGFGSFDFAGGVVTALNPFVLNPVGTATAIQLGTAFAAGFNALSRTGSLTLGEQAAFEALQLTTAQFLGPGGTETFTARSLLGSSTLIDPGQVFVPGRSVDLFQLALITQQANEVIPGVFSGPQALADLAELQRPALERRELARREGRNPFLSLQAGPFIPCSHDDPKGRCLTAGARALQADIVRRTAGGLF